jgi:hypothetical protein
MWITFFKMSQNEPFFNLKNWNLQRNKQNLAPLNLF